MSNIFVFRQPPPGFINEYFGGGGKSSTSTQTVSIPPEVLARYNAVNARAESVAQQPFQAYGGEFVAPLNPTQQAGIQATSAASQLAQPYYGEAAQGLRAAQQGGANYIGAATNQLAGAQQQAQPYFGGATMAALAGGQAVDPGALRVGRYMNPFTQSVVGATQAAMGQQQGQQLAQQQSEAIRAGAFGGERAGLQRQTLRGQQGLAQAQAIAPLYQQGYQQALQTAQQQQGVDLGAQQANRAALQQMGQQLAGLGQQQFGMGQNVSQGLAGLGQQGYTMGAGSAQQLAGLGTGAQQAALQGAQAQIGAGTLAQQTQQAQDTAQYQQFLQQRGYDFQVAQFLANIAMGTGALSGSTTSTTQPRGFFSNRGGFKTGESLHRAGKAYGGGLDPNSMGGVVYQPGAFERGGYATSGAVVDSNDLAAILAQQRQSFGPFAAAGPYGQAAGATPHGPGGIVPQQQMHTPKLVTAGALPKQQSGAGSDLGKVYSLADEATKGLSGKGLTERAGEKMGLRDSPEKIAEAKGANMPGASANATTGSQNPSGGVVPTPTPRDPTATSGSEGLWDQFTGLFKSEGGGIMPRHHYADGGSEDSQADEAIPHDPSDVMSGKDPIEGVLKAGSQKHEMLKPANLGGSGGGGGGGSSKLGLGKLAGSAIGSAFGPLGSMAGGFLGGLLPFNEGGIVPRQHHADGERANSDLPIDAEIVERAPGLDPNVVSELKREEQRQAAIPQEVKGLVVPRSQEEQPDRSLPRNLRNNNPGNIEASSWAQKQPGYVGSDGRFAVFEKPEHGASAMDNLLVGYANRGLETPASIIGRWSPVNDPGNAPGSTSNYAQHVAKKLGVGPNDKIDMSDPNVRATLASAMTEFEGGSRAGKIASVNFGAPRPSVDVGRPADAKGLGTGQELGFFDRNKGIILPVLQGIGAMASSKSISPWAAALQGLGAGAKAYGDVEAQQAQIEQAKAGTIEGLSRVGPVIGEFDPRTGLPKYSAKVPAYGTGALKPKAPLTPLEEAQNKAIQEGREAVKPTAPITDLSSAKPLPSSASTAQREHEAMYLLDAPSLQKRIDDNTKALQNARDTVTSAQAAKEEMNKLAIPIAGLAAGSVISPGALAPALGSLLSKANGVLTNMGFDPIAPDTQSQIDIADKMQAVMASAEARKLGIQARGVLDDVTKAFANKAISQDAAADIMASNYMRNYKDQHAATFTLNYGDPSRTGLQNPVGMNANAAYKSQYPQYELENKFNEEKSNLKKLLLDKIDSTNEPLISYLMGFGKNEEIKKRFTPEVLQKLIKEKYGADLTKYLLD